ncbi:MAG: ribonuclease R [Actinomycetota bacterium]|nr:ribonuclease R [Actinomycetota bacterium]
MRVRKTVLKALKHADAPMTFDELRSVAGTGVPVPQLRETMRHLVKTGHVLEAKDGTFTALRERNQVTGRLTVNPRGYGFVAAPAGDIYVAARDMHGAMHHDIVTVKLFQRSRGVGQSGEVLEITQHANDRVVGRFEKSGRMGIVSPTDRRIHGDIIIDRSSFGTAKTGDIVVVRITRFPGQGTAAQGTIEEVLGLATDPGVDVEIVIREHGLRTAFPGEVEEAAHAIPEAMGALEAGRVDLRDLLTITIDPVDARDFDDAISIERHEGGWRLWVHIADVSNYVPWGSVIDEEAVQRATSVYLVDRVLPMLPERLSNGICSLNPGVDRFTMTAEFDLDKTALVDGYKLYPSVIRSDHRCDYEGVQRWMDTDQGWPDDDVRTLVTEFRACAAALGKRRTERGGLDFESVEPKVWLDEHGRPLEVTLREKTVATNMIEEAMIAANEVVARHMRDKEAPMVYRIHEDPEPDALGAIARILAEFDYPIKDIGAATPRTFQKLIAYAHNRPERLLLNSLLLRALKRARYVDYLDGHFGLASDAYCHFTSPIRRYPDLIVHRLLKAQLAGELKKRPTSEMVPELEWLADHCSVMEREADSAENESKKVKLCELMAEHIDEVFPGIITGVTSFGAYVQLDNTAEGLVHVTAMKDDYYRFDAERFELWGENKGGAWRLGQSVEVRIADVSVSDRRIDMQWA